MTARFSKAFYERFGEGPTNEMVDWFNSVDTAYRLELREINEMNYARFDARLEQRLAELRAELKSDIAELRAELKSDIAALRGDMNGLRADFSALEDRLGRQMEVALHRQTRYVFSALLAMMVPIVGLWFR